MGGETGSDQDRAAEHFGKRETNNSVSKKPWEIALTHRRRDSPEIRSDPATSTPILHPHFPGAGTSSKILNPLYLEGEIHFIPQLPHSQVAMNLSNFFFSPRKQGSGLGC